MVGGLWRCYDGFGRARVAQERITPSLLGMQIKRGDEPWRGLDPMKQQRLYARVP